MTFVVIGTLRVNSTIGLFQEKYMQTNHFKNKVYA